MKTCRYYPFIVLSSMLFLTLMPSVLKAQTTAPKLVRLANTTHPRATSASDRGKVPDDFPINRVLIVLKRSPEQQKTLETFLSAVQNPASPEYHRWLKPEEFGQQFGASQKAISTVKAWLTAQGLQVNRTGKGGMDIEFSGPAGLVGNALHTEIHKYSVEGRDHWANSTDISVPESIAAAMEGVALLNDFKDYQSGAVLQFEPEGKVLDRSKPLYRGASGRYYLLPSDFGTIYSIPNTYTGSGVTIGVVGDADFDTDDVDDFRARFGLPANTPVKLYDGINPGTNSATSEAMLDVTWSGAIASGATVAYVGATSILLSEEYIVDNNLADILTESFFSCEANFSGAEETLSLFNSLRAQAAAQGITWVGITGDSGPYNCENFHRELSYSSSPVLAVNALASSPFVVAVGGTQFNTTGSSTNYWSTSNSALGYFPEAAWNQSCYFNVACFTSIVAGGGGQSTEPGGKPSWQTAVGVGPSMTNDNTRDLPDISFTASWQIDPYVICMNRSCKNSTSFGFYSTGGTSAAAPSFAGIVALVEQKAGGRLGAINPVLYQLAASQFSQCLGVASSTSGCVYNDVVTGTTATPGASSAYYPATPGYDMATGLGSVNVTNLLNLWSAGNPIKTTTQLSISPTALVHGSAAQAVISVAPQSGSGVPSGPVTLLAGASQLICPGTVRTRTIPDGCVSVAVPSLANGGSQSAVQGLPGGSYTVTAAYGGDGSFAPSVSSPVQVVISPEASSVGLTTSIATAAYGTGVALIATVVGTSNSGIPTGLVTFYDNQTLLGTAAPNTFGTATFVVATFSPGSHSITAAYSGDPSFNASASAAAVAVQIQAGATSLSLGNACASAGGMVMPTLLYSGLGAAPTGSIAYSVAGVAIATVPLNAQFQAPFTVPAGLTPVPAAIQVSYSGDANYAPSAPSTINVGLTDCAGVMVDSATSTHFAAIGGLATIYGISMAPGTVAEATPAWPTTIGGTTVSITDSNNQTALAQLAYVSPSQINLCVPSSLKPGVVTVQVNGSTASNQFQATVEASSPVIFAAQTIAVSSDGTVSPTEPLAPIVIPSKGTVYLILYATGVRNHAATSVVEVLIGDTLVGTYPVEPAYAGAEGIFPGLDQINLQIPNALARSGNANVAITIVDSGNGSVLQESNSLALSFPNQ